MATKMIDLGVARKDMASGYSCSPCCSSDEPDKKKEWENTIIYPDFTVEGMHAELMGAEDLNVDDVVEVVLKLKVKSKRDDSRRIEGEKAVKRDICIGFCILATSNLTDLGEDKGGAEATDAGTAMMEAEDAAPVRALLGG